MNSLLVFEAISVAGVVLAAVALAVVVRLARQVSVWVHDISCGHHRGAGVNGDQTIAGPPAGPVDATGSELLGPDTSRYLGDVPDWSAR